MKSFFVVLVLVISFNLSIQGQQFQPGYFINLQGDTIKANVGFSMNNGTMSAVLVEQPGQSPSIYKPLQIRGGGRRGEHFVSAIVSSDKTPAIESMTTDTVFLDVLVYGKMRLLKYQDRFNKTHYYVQREDQSTAELGLHVTYASDGVSIMNSPSYRHQLKTEFPECPSLYPEIDAASYNEGRLKALFKKCYECKYKTKIPTSKKEKVNNKVFLTAGIVAGASMITELYPDLGYTFDKVIAPNVGAYLDINIPTRGKPFALRNELTYRAYKLTSATLYYDIPPFPPYTRTAYIEESYVRYGISARYNMSYAKVRPFLNVGYSYSHATNFNPYTLETSGTNTKELNLLNGYKSGFSLLFFGFGIQVKKFSAEVRYESGGGMQPRQSTSSIGMLSLFGAYSLSRK